MSLIAALNAVGFLAVLTALILLLRGWARALNLDARALFAGLLLLTLFGNFSNVLEWSGIAMFDPVEDNVELLEPVLWVFFFYAFLKAVDIAERERTERALRVSEERYRTLFGDSPISIWEEDFSVLKAYLDRLRDGGIEDFRSYFESHPEEVAHCASLVKVVDVNRAALTLYGAESKDALLKSLDVVFTEDAYPGFTEELIGIAQGKGWVETDAVNRTLKGEDKTIVVNWRVVPGYEETLSRCIVSIRDITEREQTAQALRESKVLLSRAEEMAHLGSWKWDLETDMFMLSEEWQRIHGWQSEQLSRDDLFATAHPDDLPKIQRAFDRALAGFEPYDVEYRIIRRDDGVERTVRAYGEVVLEEESNPIGMYGTSRDVTDRKQIERALHESERRFQLTIQHSPIGVGLVDSQGDLIDCNHALEELVGYSREELLTMNFADITHPDDLERERQLIDDLWKQKSTEYRMEKRYIHKDGHTVLVDVAASLFADATDDLAFGFAFVQDITERKRAEQALRESEAMLRQVIDLVPYPIFAKDGEGRFLLVNAAGAQFGGKTVEQMQGHLESEWVLDKEVLSEIQADDRAVIKSGQAKFFAEDHVVDAQGREHVLQTIKIPFQYKNGEPPGILGISIDITEQKRMETQLHQQAQLAAVGQLAAGIAHDFRNRLAPILIYAQMDRIRSDLPSAVVKHLRVIIEEAQSAADLVQQILDFSSRSMIDRQPLDLHTFVADVLSNVLRPGIPENIALSLDIASESAGPLTVMADRGRIRQVLTNLAVNARDAMPAGGELRFTLSRREVRPDAPPPVAEMQPGDWICLSVTDTGTGISEEILPHIFEPFFTTKDVDKGKGLGLPQVYGIMRQHEGYIDVETVLGEGTTFLLYLPAYPLTGQEQAEDSLTSSLLGHNETILLVEDHQALRDAGASILESLGYRVLTATDGQEALAIYQARQDSGSSADVDLLVTDLIMPEMGGRKLLQALQRLTPGIKALAVTGHALEEDDRVALRAMGFREVVNKPFDLDGLARAVRRALNRSSE